MANSIDYLRFQPLVEPLLIQGVRNSHVIDMIALTGCPEKGQNRDRSPECNVGLISVILGAVELRREEMRTVERISVDDVLSSGISTVIYYHRWHG